MQQLLVDARRRGFDVRKVAYLAWLVEFGSRRDAAYALRRCAAGSGWLATIYVDRTGWVVRLGRVERPCDAPLHAYGVEVTRLAGEHGGAVRGVCLEELQRRDVWHQLAMDQRFAPTTPQRFRWVVPERPDPRVAAASARRMS